MVKTVKLFVEGGGDSNSLRRECRAAFSSFLEKAGLSGYMPRVVASGSRIAAYSDYCTAIANGEDAVFLVDSEAAIILPSNHLDHDIDNIQSWDPWYHLQHRQSVTGEIADPWAKPSGVSNDDCHLMVQSMESWFLADIAALRIYYGSELNENCLPKRKDIENIEKDTVIDSIRAATVNTRKGRYSKGNHSFGILMSIDPNIVANHSPWAKRFISLLSNKMRSIR